MSTRFSVGAGVINDEDAVVVGVGVSIVNPYSVENVISWSHFVTDILDPSPVRVVAHIVVFTGAKTVSHFPVPSTDCL